MALDDDAHPIHGWLQAVTNDELPTAGLARPESPQESHQSPLTPRVGRLSSSEPPSLFNSPTSNFTLDSIFDHAPKDDDSQNVSTATSSVCFIEEQKESAARQQAPIEVADTVSPPVRSPPEESTETSKPCHVEKETKTLLQEKPRLVWATSCLQCVLKGLPCDKAVPQCSRCQRCGEDGHCLLQFVPYYDAFTTPMLVRLSSDETQVTMEKEEQQREILNRWQIRRERNNWVLPCFGKRCKVAIMHTCQGTLLKYKRQPSHPGRGEGNERTATLSLSNEAVKEARQVYTYSPV